MKGGEGGVGGGGGSGGEGRGSGGEGGGVAMVSHTHLVMALEARQQEQHHTAPIGHHKVAARALGVQSDGQELQCSGENRSRVQHVR